MATDTPHWTVDERGRPWWGPDSHGAYCDIAGSLCGTPEGNEAYDALVRAVRDADQLTKARAAYLAGDWDALEQALDIAQQNEGKRVRVSDLLTEDDTDGR